MLMMIPVGPSISNQFGRDLSDEEKNLLFADQCAIYKSGHFRFRQGVAVVYIGAHDLNTGAKYAKNFAEVLSQMDMSLLAKQIEACNLAGMLRNSSPSKHGPSPEERQMEFLVLTEEKLNHAVGTSEIAKLIDSLAELKGTDAALAVIPYLDKKYDSFIRQQAVKALEKLQDRRSIAALIEHLKEPITYAPDFDCSEASRYVHAINALQGIGDPSVIPFLKEFAADTKQYKRACKAAEDAIARF